ncbi:MAG: DUF1559 domain-containing protein, partial [Pirellulaceae bacterium]|nr:DUF1559 domain-containing protein [Pirellulaceae bacterium]
MQFGLSTLLWLFVVVACALGTFGPWGLLLLAFLLVQMPMFRTLGTRHAVVTFWLAICFQFSFGSPEYFGTFATYSCWSTLRQIGAAMNQYHDDHGSYPPAYVVDSRGQPLYSWRVLLLPYLNEQALHSRIRLDRSWDSPDNRSLPTPRVFQCDWTVRTEGSSATTHYVAVTGPETMWPGKDAIRREDIHDGLSRTVMVVEIKGSDIHWMEPRDLKLADVLAKDRGRSRVPSSCHSTGSRPGFWYREAPTSGHILLADGEVVYPLPPPTREELAALSSVNDGIPLDPAELGRRKRIERELDWSRVVGCPLFFLSLIVLVSRGSTNTSARPIDPCILRERRASNGSPVSRH